MASWATALGVWPFAWLLTVVSQGLGTAAVGGEWIGVSLPFGEVPWALVNEPNVAFASSREALVAYWLPPSVVPALLVLALPALAPTSGGWLGEFVLFHLTAGLAVVGLGWGVLLGNEAGPAAGLATFWRIGPAWTSAVALTLGVVGGSLAVLRLGGQFWHAQGGPTRWRCTLLAVAHLAAPAASWVAASIWLGWKLRLLPVGGLCVVVIGGFVTAVLFRPRSPLRRPPPVGTGSLVGIATLSLLVAMILSWLGAAEGGQPRALLWGHESATSNVRSGMTTVRLMPLPVRTTRPEPSAGGS